MCGQMYICWCVCVCEAKANVYLLDPSIVGESRGQGFVPGTRNCVWHPWRLEWCLCNSHRSGSCTTVHNTLPQQMWMTVGCEGWHWILRSWPQRQMIPTLLQWFSLVLSPLSQFQEELRLQSGLPWGGWARLQRPAFWPNPALVLRAVSSAAASRPAWFSVL